MFFLLYLLLHLQAVLIEMKWGRVGSGPATYKFAWALPKENEPTQ
jgi:hypothetical protein